MRWSSSIGSKRGLINSRARLDSQRFLRSSTRFSNLSRSVRGLHILTDRIPAVDKGTANKDGKDIFAAIDLSLVRRLVNPPPLRLRVCWALCNHEGFSDVRQMKGERVLRVDRRSRSHGPWRLKRLYRKRSAVERTISRLKMYFGLCQLRTRGLRNVLTHVLLCLIAMLMTALSLIKNGFPDRMRSPTFWSYITCSK